MKKFISVLAISMFATLSSAFAGTVQMDANDFASLPECGGVLQTKISDDATQLNLVFSNVAECSNFDIVSANGEKVNYPNQKLQGKNQSRYGGFTIPSSMIDLGTNTIRVMVKSNSGKHSDTIVITVRETPTQPTGPVIYMNSTATSALNFCGGTVQTKVSNGQLNVIFENVSKCSNFDILAANGEKVNYPNLKLQGKDGARAGSFTLPKSVIDLGGNVVRIRLNSNSGKTYDNIVIYFFAL
jgi:hypothetical protein